MPTDVLMPQMGESVAEGTIVRWIKRVGEPIDRDEPLFEISTDKVDAEIPAPEAGVLVQILVHEGETVPVNSVVAVIGRAGEQPAEPAPAAEVCAVDVAQSDDHAAPSTTHAAASTTATTRDDRRRTRSSPLVRRMAQVHGIDITRLTGTGISGRVTKRDVERVLAGGASAPVAQAPAAMREHPAAPATPIDETWFGADGVRAEPMSVMRRKIADHMLASVRTSPHVYSTYEVDFGRIDQIRKRHQTDYVAAGTRLTYTACIAKATVETIREFPFANASLQGETIVYKRDVHLGIAVALDRGLIVPVIRAAQSRSLIDLARAIQDLAARARSKQLKPEEVQDGTFTLTNPGMFGGLLGFPIINQPQVAILAIGTIEKRVAVIDDMIAVRPMGYLTLGYDHRLIDGADGGRFLQRLKQRLQEFDESWV